MGDLTLERDRREFINLCDTIPDTNKTHALALVEAFKTPSLSGGSARERFLRILDITKNLESVLPIPAFPTTHFNKQTVEGPGVQARGRGDLGFRRELQDSIRYQRDASGTDVEMWTSSSNQIGHFLTAAHMGYYIETASNFYEVTQLSRAKARASENELLGFVRDLFELMPDPMTGGDPRLMQILEAENIQKAMIGHELVPDPAGPLSALNAATSQDVANFLRSRLDLITVRDGKDREGNSYQDLLLTWVGYRFGQRIADDVFSSRGKAAEWLRIMIMDVDLGSVRPGSEFYGDALQMKAMLDQFRAIQAGRQ